MSKKKKAIEELLSEMILPNSFNLENWRIVTAESIIDIRDGTHGTPKYVEQGFPLITSKNLKHGELDFSNVKYISEEDHNLICKRSKVDNHDILFAMIGTIGNPVLVNNSSKEFSIKNVALFKPNRTVINSKYLYYYLKSPLYLQPLINNAKGSTQKFVSLGMLRKSPIILPPLNEQKRIVEKVKRLLNKIEEAKWLIEEAKETFELRRAAILDKAFRGELTKKWRKEKNNKNSVPKLSIISVEAPHSLPKGWTWITLEDGCEKITDGTHHSPKSYPTGDYMYITAKNIKEKGVLLDNVSYVSKEVHEEIYSRCDVKKGDVLYIKDGATTGIATVNQLSEEFSLLSSVGLLRPKKDVLLPEYLMFCLNSSTTKRRMLGMMSGNAIRRLTLKKIKQGIIPLPPIDEQRIIISILDKVKIIDEKINLYSDVDQTIENLKQAILSKAFRGELGTNDPREENSIELLKEILQEQVK
ncbi:restriction endonuclease subunit S [Bacillus toyonensis]|uniref:restriction endonuclease subunit S n=1 Tax=Bacillus toyonensis TaxID=155322 RepID=UPI0021D356A6|nr:restriction endonuclease subunit S [Bacillus toyonensis]MCU5396543.1 restriction endonuclease subunit S [Bacillus toyonensis]